MNEILDNFLLAGEKSMHGMILRQPGLIYSSYGPFTKNKKRMQKFKETTDSRYIYQKKLDKACFQHGIDYGDFKDLPRRTASNKVLPGKAFNIAETQKCDGYQRGLPSMAYKFFDKTFSVGTVKYEIMPKQQLADKLHKPTQIRKFEK